MNGCNIIGDGHRPTGKFKTALFENGVNLCDTCQLKDCVATESQAASLQFLEKEYKKSFAPDCDKHVIENRKKVIALAKKERKNAKRNPTGRKPGRPRKGVNNEHTNRCG